MRRALALLCLAAACGPAPLPAPRIRSVEPASMLASDARSVMVQLDAVLPFYVDYQSAEARAHDEVTVLIGGRQLAATAIQPGGGVLTFVPSVFTPGALDLTVRLADEREATLTGGFTIEPGDWPDAYEFVSVIADQRAGVPFLVTLRALKGGVTHTAFGGTVNLSSDKAEVAPALTSPFDAGLVTERAVTISHAVQNVALVVSDAAGHTGTSNTFRVLP